MTQFDLTREQELELITKSQMGDKAATAIFVQKNQGLVHKIANGLSRYGVPYEDMVQEGNIGLLTAIQKFDQLKNARFSTMAFDYIRGPIYAYIRANTRLVKCPSSPGSAKLFYSLPRMVPSPGQLTSEKIKEISTKLGVTVDEIKTMIPFVFGTDHHISDSSPDDDEPTDGQINLEHFLGPGDSLQDEIQNEEEDSLIRECLRECISELPDIHKVVINLRWLGESGDIKSLREIATLYQASPQAINQREVHALKLLRNSMRSKMASRHKIFM